MVFNAGGKKALRTLTSRCKSIPVECLKCEYKRARRAARATIWVCGREISKFPLELVRLCQEPPERCWGPGCPVACFQIHHKGKETSNVTSSLTYLIHYIYVQWFFIFILLYTIYEWKNRTQIQIRTGPDCSLKALSLKGTARMHVERPGPGSWWFELIPR